jgi:hypothetical protein
MGIPMGVMAMEVIRTGVTPTVVMAMGVIRTGVNPARVTRNQRIERVLARHDLAGMARVSSFGRHTLQDRAEVTMPLCRLTDCLRGLCTRQGSNLQPYDPKSYTLSN